MDFNENKWRRLVLNGRITFTKLVPAFLFIKPATKRDLLVNPIAAGTCYVKLWGSYKAGEIVRRSV